MKHIFYSIFLILITSCGNEKSIQLPEITNSDIQEVLDISPAYIFYDETKPDSLELNRKNLISTTNWLVNVDKRLTLDQVIPQIIFLQDKKENSNHKKEGVKNYYTCNDTSIKNLGFLEFTDVVYNLSPFTADVLKAETKDYGAQILFYKKDKSILIFDFFNGKVISRGFFNLKDLDLESLSNIILSFDKESSFQEYISYKSELKNLLPKGVTILDTEFIY